MQAKSPRKQNSLALLIIRNIICASTMILGVELGNIYSMQLANNLPPKQILNQYFGVLGPIVLKIYLHQYKHLKVE